MGCELFSRASMMFAMRPTESGSKNAMGRVKTVRANGVEQQVFRLSGIMDQWRF